MINLALVGNCISHSKSPQVYESLIGRISYHLLDYENVESVPPLDEIFKKYQLKGLNITSPYKGYFLNHVQMERPLWRKLNAINAVACIDSNYVGINTDYLAIKKIIYDFISDGVKSIVLLGNGVMARITLFILDEIRPRLNIEYKQYYREAHGNLGDIISGIYFGKDTMIINACSRKFVLKKKLLGEALFWDYNYGMDQHNQLLSRYIDGFSLLRLQAIYALKFMNIYNHVT